MKDKEPITAESLIEKMKDAMPFVLSESIKPYIKEALIVFAKYHREIIIEAVKENAMLNVFTDHNIGMLDKICITKVLRYEDANEFDTIVKIDSDSIENAYKEENII